MSTFLHLKHWQLFSLLIGIPFVVQAIVAGSFFEGKEPSSMMITFPLMMIVVIGIFCGWFYSLGTNLHKKLPQSVTMNLKRFKLFLAIPVVYMLFLSLFMLCTIGAAESLGTSTLQFAGIIVPLHLFSMFCIFYCLHFIAKALKATEWQRPVTFSDFAGEFFLIWFYPIGIWVVQPRINKLFAENLPDNGDLFNRAS